MSDDEWNWQFRKPAKRTYDDLDEHAQNRITDKLDEIVTDQWRDPDDYLEPLTGAPYSKRIFLMDGQLMLRLLLSSTSLRICFGMQPTTTSHL